VLQVMRHQAPSLRQQTALADWFFLTTRFFADCALGGEARRHSVQEGAMMPAQDPTPDFDEPSWTQVAPLLDVAIAALPRKDRDAVLLHFFMAKSMCGVGEQLGVSEDAAKKRVRRAVGKLKGFYFRRGVKLSGARLADMLGRSAVQAAPAGFAARVAKRQLMRMSWQSGSTPDLFPRYQRTPNPG
jgi:DNA-directed RNA polymerase specialized sigma24 family protein